MPLIKMESLIKEVRREPSLYDTNHPDYTKKAFKDLTWNKIAKDLRYKNGETAKEAWLKLRNCHRDAMRRRSKLLKNGSEGIRPWKLEKQMEFLVPYMTSRAVGDVMVDSLSQELDTNSENSVEFQQTDTHTTQQMEEGCHLHTADISIDMTQERERFIDVSTMEMPKDRERYIDMSAIEIPKDQNRFIDISTPKMDFPEDDDDLKQFFNTMYSITRKMPALSQHKLKRKIFNLVSDEEEVYLLSKVTESQLMTTFEPHTHGPMKPCYSDENE